jgi:uncharacterized protein
MLLDISRALRTQGTEFPFELGGEIPTQDILGEPVSFEGVALSGTYSAAGKSVLIMGQLIAAAHARCAKCLGPAHAELMVPFRETFVQDGDPEDPDKFAFEGSLLDLSHLALSLAVLNLPMRFVCGENCKGLCPVCGENLNKNQCTCRKELQAKHPFEALQMLKKDEEV